MAVTSDLCLGDGDDRWPPGFRFHPTDEELVVYYLKRKICKRRLKLDIIRELDVYKWDPEDLPGQSYLKTGDRQWFFFSPRDRKYPNGGRANRATRYGYWKATGKDRNVACNSRFVGIKKTLVFYRGRAPSGERTDWVMHEYTMDEGELKRCQNIQDYYALYKVFKKSGPGPKNGEQYGAPFREEDWADDEFADVTNPVLPEMPVVQYNAATSVDNVRDIGQPEPPIDDISEQIANVPAFNPSQMSDYTSGILQVAGEEEIQSTLEDPSFREVVFPKPTSLLAASVQQLNEQASVDFNLSASSKLHLPEAHEVTSAPNDSERAFQLHQSHEADFLEMDDLSGPQPTVFNIEKPTENLLFDNFDGLSEFELYHDACMFLRDLGPVDQEVVPHPYVTSFGNSLVNEVNCQVQPQVVANLVNYQLQPQVVADQVGYQTQPPLMVDEVVYQLQPQSLGTDQMSNQVWMHDKGSTVFTSSESNYGTVSQTTSGVEHESSTNFSGANGNQNAMEADSAAGGWFSSALWTFVDSIPTTPASAAEGPLVNKAFERMSSFSRVKMNVKNMNVGAVNGAANVRRSCGKRGFVLLSIFGVLCAMLWVLIGNVGVLERPMSS